MRLAINGYRLRGPLTGVPRYLLSLLREWERDPGPFTDIRVFTQPPPPRAHAPTFATIRTCSTTPWVPYVVSEQVLLPWHADADILFCPANTMPVGYRRPCVVTIHDVLQEIMPGTFPWWARLRHAPLYRYSARRATLVLTDSENSKAGILRYYRLPGDRVRVIPLAAAPCFRPLDDSRKVAAVRQRQGVGAGPYVLFVGKLSVRRNIPLLLKAVARAAGQESGRRLILVGVNHLKLPLARLVAEAGLDGRVLHRCHVSDDDLVALYNGAGCLALPSLYEGFGLPVLEAMACGCPVVVFRNSSLVEVGGDAACYPETADEDGLTLALRAVLDSPALRDKLRVRGLRRAAQFSWRRTAEQTLQALEEAAHA